MSDETFMEVKEDLPSFKDPVMVQEGDNIRHVEKEDYIEEQNQSYIQKLKHGLMACHLRLENYIQNVERFYETQPFFYDQHGMFWFWDILNDKWVITDEIDIMNLIEKNLQMYGQTITKGIKSNYIEAFKRLGRQKIPQPAKKQWIQFKNKAFSLTAKKNYTVTPHFFFTNPIPYEIGETSDTPVMDKLFEEWVGKDNVPLLYEIIAYCCYTDYPIHRIFCLVGSGSNGKSRYMALLEKFLGKDNICASELDNLIINRFEAFKLYRKLVCSMGETNFGVLNKTSMLKKLSGQDLIGYEKKGKDPFDDFNYAKIIIASNSLPSSDDTSDGFYRRWIIIDFPNQFQEGKDILDTIPPIEYNNLAKKVTEILPKLIESGAFTNQGDIQTRKERYILSSNPLSLFIKEMCVVDPESYVSYDQAYTAYIQYLKFHKKRRVKTTEFKKALEDEGFWVEKTSKKNDNGDWKTGRWVEGLTLRANYANYDTFYTSSLYKRGGIENEAQMAQMARKPTQEDILPIGWDPKQVCRLKCNVDDCHEIECNFDSDGVPYCKFHFENMARIEVKQ